MEKDKKKNNVITVNFELLRRYPSWYIKTIPANMYYYEEVLEYFDLIEDEKRFVDGCSFFCKKCNKPCYCRMDYSEENKCFIVTTISCKIGCGFTWKKENVEPLWVRVLEDWEEE